MILRFLRFNSCFDGYRIAIRHHGNGAIAICSIDPDAHLFVSPHYLRMGKTSDVPLTDAENRIRRLNSFEKKRRA